MIPQKFFQSQQTLNSDRLSSSNSLYHISKSSSYVIINPYPQSQSLKFPKNRAVRRQTEMNTLIESSNNPQRLSIRPFARANKHTLDDIPEIKRIAKFGAYNPLSRSLDEKCPQPRTFSDIGLKGNMKKVQYLQKHKPDPIIIGDVTKLVNKSNCSVWKQERKLRDNGKVTKETMSWQVDSERKKGFYSGKNIQKKVDHCKSSIFPSDLPQTDYSRVLNYQTRK